MATVLFSDGIVTGEAHPMRASAGSNPGGDVSEDLGWFFLPTPVRWMGVEDGLGDEGGGGRRSYTT